MTNGSICAPPGVPDEGCAAPPVQPLPRVCCNATAAVAAVVEGGGAAVEANRSTEALEAFSQTCEELRSCGAVLGEGVPLAIETSCRAAALLRQGVDLTGYNLSSTLLPKTFATYQQARPQIEADCATTEAAVDSFAQAAGNVSLAAPVVSGALSSFTGELQAKWEQHTRDWEQARASAAADVLMLSQEVALQVSRVAALQHSPSTPGAFVAAAMASLVAAVNHATAQVPTQIPSTFPGWWDSLQPTLQSLVGLDLIVAAGSQGSYVGELDQSLQASMDAAALAGGGLVEALDSLC